MESNSFPKMISTCSQHTRECPPPTPTCSCLAFHWPSSSPSCCFQSFHTCLSVFTARAAQVAWNQTYRKDCLNIHELTSKTHFECLHHSHFILLSLSKDSQWREKDWKYKYISTFYKVLKVKVAKKSFVKSNPFLPIFSFLSFLKW